MAVLKYTAEMVRDAKVNSSPQDSRIIFELLLIVRRVQGDCKIKIKARYVVKAKCIGAEEKI